MIAVGCGRLAGWTLLGALLGGAVSFFVPNLRRQHGMFGGAIGGGLGAIGFLTLTAMAGESLGRLAGGAILGFCIGVMLAWIEETIRAREASLIVHWTGNEQTVISLGLTPVTLGSSSEAHVYLPREQGYPPVAAAVTFTGGQVEMQNRMSNSRHVLTNGNKLQIGPLQIEVRTAA